MNEGITLLAAYAAGIAIPFLGAALFTGAFLRLMLRMRRYLGPIEKIMGGILVITGLLIFVGAMPALGALLQEYVPIIGRIG